MNLILVNERLPYASTTFYTLDLALELQARDHQVRLCTRGGDLRQVFQNRGVKTYSVKLNYFSFRRLLGFLREFRAKLIHVQNVRSVELGQRISEKLSVPHVLTVHKVPGEQNLGLAHPKLAGVIALNEMIRADLVNAHGIPKNLIRVIKHGVDVEAFRPRTESVLTPRDSDKLPVIGSVGRLAAVKGHDTFLRAARRVLDSGVEALFMIVGEGTEESALRRLVRELDLQESVTLLPHMPSRRELYRIFDIVSVSTLRGGVGATALEAMAMAKPVVASAVGDMLELIHNGKTGLLVEPQNPEALASALISLLRDPEAAAQLGRDARQFACEHFSLLELVDTTLEFYDDVEAQLHERWLERS